MIYLPNTNYACYVIQNENVVRAYFDVPTSNSTIRYRDYYPNFDYNYREGEQTFSNYSTLPVCLNNQLFTDNVFYHNHLDKILIIFIIFAIISFYIPIKVFGRLFKRFL